MTVRSSDDYLLAIGDSSTWGYAELEDKWTTHLETLSGRRVLKCGISGTGPRHQEIKARKTIAKVGVSPTVILVLYDKWNDLNDDVTFPDDFVIDGHRGTTFEVARPAHRKGDRLTRGPRSKPSIARICRSRRPSA